MADTIKDTPMPSITTALSITEDITDPPAEAQAKNMVIMVMSVGNRPLQGTKLLVRTATSLSLSEFIILHPVTPAALQPKPIHMVSACFPQALHFLKHLSRLKATLGR